MRNTGRFKKEIVGSIEWGSKQEVGRFIFTGMNVVQQEDYVTVDQIDYASKVKFVYISPARQL